MHNSILRRTLAGVLAAVMAVSTVSGAQAAPKDPRETVPTEQQKLQKPEKVLERELTQEEISKAEVEAEKLFTELLQQDEAGIWRVNEQAAKANGVDVSDLRAIADQLNTQGTEEHAFGSPEYTSCVLDNVGLGALFEAVTKGAPQFQFLLAAQNWREVAWVLFRLVGGQALRGGIVGTAAALAAAGAWCATPWAR